MSIHSVRISDVEASRTSCINHPEHLNTPRLIADSAGTPVWKWDQAEPFGNNPADENPSALGAFDLPLRFPGQRYDAETALHYNHFRDYDPSLGIYIQSDPIGLKAGLNTYAYVGARPLQRIDYWGLEWMLMGREISPEGRNTIMCQGESAAVILDNPFNSSWKCPLIRECQVVHEQSHISDAVTQKPNICRGNTGIRMIGSNDVRERLQSEADSFRKQVECLESKLQSPTCSDDCRGEIQRYIRIINTIQLPRIFNGTY